MSAAALNVLVLGGYGFFGSRIARSLCNDSRIRLSLAGRDRGKVEAAARVLGLDSAQAVCVDAHGASLAPELRRRGIHVVIHTAGPFQGQSSRWNSAGCARVVRSKQKKYTRSRGLRCAIPGAGRPCVEQH